MDNAEGMTIWDVREIIKEHLVIDKGKHIHPGTGSKVSGYEFSTKGNVSEVTLVYGGSMPFVTVMKDGEACEKMLYKNAVISSRSFFDELRGSGEIFVSDWYKEQLNTKNIRPVPEFDVSGKYRNMFYFEVPVNLTEEGTLKKAILDALEFTGIIETVHKKKMNKIDAILEDAQKQFLKNI